MCLPRRLVGGRLPLARWQPTVLGSRLSTKAPASAPKPSDAPLDWVSEAAEAAPKAFALAAIKPYDPSSSWAQVLPWNAYRRGPDLFALVYVPLERSRPELLEAQIAHAGRAQDELVGGGELSWRLIPRLVRGADPRGGANSRKLVPGASVAVQLDPAADARLRMASLGVSALSHAAPSMAGAVGLRSDEVSTFVVSAYANAWQGYGRVVRVHRGTVDVLLAGSFSQQGSETIRLVAEREGEHVVNADVARVIAHATHRNVFLPSTLDVVRQDVAMLLPEPIALAHVAFHEASRPPAGSALGRRLGDEELPARSCAEWLQGALVLSIRGKPVDVLNSTGRAQSTAVNLQGVALGIGGGGLGLATAIMLGDLRWLVPAAALGALGASWSSICGGANPTTTRRR